MLDCGPQRPEENWHLLSSDGSVFHPVVGLVFKTIERPKSR